MQKSASQRIGGSNRGEERNERSNPKVMIVANTAWNLVNFRSGLIRAFISGGFEVVAVASEDKYSSKLPELGCSYIPLPMSNRGTQFSHDLILLGRFYRLIRHERPDVYLGFTIKPNIYGALVASALRVPIINNITGLGAVFIKGGWLERLVRWLYKFSLLRAAKVFFQNDEDRLFFISNGLVGEGNSARLPGSGVDLRRFRPVALPGRSSVRFLMVARILWDKGVGEFIEAARLLRRRGVRAEFYLLGSLGAQNPSAVSLDEVGKWVDEGVINYLGESDDVRAHVAKVDCVVLPSYREGTPRVLLEAAAMARPVVTTDSVGCRDVVDDGINGYLCRSKDAVDLADKLEQVASLSKTERKVMGNCGRKKVEREFDEQIVIRKYLEEIHRVLRR